MSINRATIDTSLIPAPYGENILRHKDGNTWDIISVIMRADQKMGKNMCAFAEQFEATYESLYDLWYWVRKNIKYIADKPGHEKVKHPEVTWKDGFGDCKSFSLLVASVLRCIGVKYKYRFTSYSKNSDPTHVYVIAQLKGREIIIDSVHTKYDDEADYIKKWDKMPTRIYELRGPQKIAIIGNARPTLAERIADAPKATAPKRNINITTLSGGLLTLELLDEQLRILIAFYGDPDGILQKARNIIFQAKRGNFHYNNTLPTGYIDPRLNILISQIQEASKNIRINGTNFRIGEIPYNRPEKYPDNCNDILNSPENKKLLNEFNFLVKQDPNTRDSKRLKELFAWREQILKDLDECALSQEFAKLVDKRIGKTAHHVLYEFVDRPNEAPNTVGTKTVLHRLAITSIGQLAYIDRSNVRIMVENGIMAENAAKPELNKITPKDSIDILKNASKLNDPRARINEPVTIAVALIGLLTAAIKAAQQFKNDMKDKRKLAFDASVRGYGSLEFSGDSTDWSGFDSGMPGGPGSEEPSSFTSYLPWILGGAAALFVVPQLLKK